MTDAQLFWGTIYFNPSHKIPGGYHLWGFNEQAGGDSLTGTLKSQNFVLGGNGKINFLVGGGRDIDKLYVALVRASDGKELFKETATNYEEYQRKIWDASQYIGQESNPTDPPSQSKIPVSKPDSQRSSLVHWE